jgi:subtilisin family serine protease
VTKIEPYLEYRLHLWREQTPEERIASGSDSPVRVSVRFTGDPEALRNAGLVVQSIESNIAIGETTFAQLERVAAVDGVVAIEGDKPTRLQLNVSVPQIHGDVVRGAPLSLTGAGTIVGIVDTGIDIFHHSFRRPDDSSRVLSIWDQTLTAGVGEHPPAGFLKGVELSAVDIALGLAHPDLPFRSQDNNGHGSHVAGIAAGNGSQSGGTGADLVDCHKANTYIGVAPEADLIIVKTTPSQTDNADGVKYIFGRASDLGKPAVVNISLGYELGAHDGTGVLESRIDGLVSGPGQVVVAAAGNDADNGIHALKPVNANATVTLAFTVPANDLVTDEFDIWYDGGARLRFTLTPPPPAAAYTSINPGDPSGFLGGGPPGGERVWAQSGLNNPDNGRHRIGFTIAPTGAGAAIRAGQWTITFHETAGAATTVTAWIDLQRNDKYPRFIAADRDPTQTVTIPGTAKNIITVGAYDPVDSPAGVFNLAAFSSRGPTVDGRRKPDICAPGVGINAPRSKERSVWYCCDCCLGFYVAMNGTSMAAPHVTGVAALMLQRNRTLTYDQVRQQIWNSGRPPDPITGPTLPNSDWGYGMVDAQTACTGVAPAAAVGGGGGGGAGGGGPHLTLPIAATAVAGASIASRLRMLEQRLGDNALWHELGALVSTHFDEVHRLINGNRRVAVAWHRMNGPRLVRYVLQTAGDSRYSLLPPQRGGAPFDSQIDRMLALLARYGSPALRSDIRRYRSLVVALTGVSGPEREFLAAG